MAPPLGSTCRAWSTRRPIDPEDIAVYYPVIGRISLRPGTTQTGILFSRPAAATREDMHQAIVSLVMSLLGTEMTDRDQRSGVVHQSFAESFINEAGQRQARAGNGIGNRGVSTALVASLTVPVDELAGIVGARLLRTAIEQLSAPLTKVESNRTDGEEFLTKAGVHQILRRPSAVFAEPAPGHGAKEVATTLTDRLEAMRVGIESLRADLSRDSPAARGELPPGRRQRRDARPRWTSSSSSGSSSATPRLPMTSTRAGSTDCCIAGGPRRRRRTTTPPRLRYRSCVTGS